MALRLLTRFGDPQALFAAAPADWTAAGLPTALHAGLLRPDWTGVEQDLRWLEGDGCHLVTWLDGRYPPLLREIAQAPAALFCHGDPALLSRRQLAIVG